MAMFDQDKFDWHMPGVLIDFTDPDGHGNANDTAPAFFGKRFYVVREWRRFGTFMSGSLAGALRVTPPRPFAARNGRSHKNAAADKAQPGDASLRDCRGNASPVEAGALFPVGQSIAGDNWIALAPYLVKAKAKTRRGQSEPRRLSFADQCTGNWVLAHSQA